MQVCTFLLFSNQMTLDSGKLLQTCLYVALRDAEFWNKHKNNAQLHIQLHCVSEQMGHAHYAS